MHRSRTPELSSKQEGNTKDLIVALEPLSMPSEEGNEILLISTIVLANWLRSSLFRHDCRDLVQTSFTT